MYDTTQRRLQQQSILSKNGTKSVTEFKVIWQDPSTAYRHLWHGGQSTDRKNRITGKNWPPAEEKDTKWPFGPDPCRWPNGKGHKVAEGNNSHSEGDKKRTQSGNSIFSNGHKVAILKVCTAWWCRRARVQAWRHRGDSRQKGRYACI